MKTRSRRWKEFFDMLLIIEKRKHMDVSTSTGTTKSWHGDKETMTKMGRSKACGPDDLQIKVITMAAEVKAELLICIILKVQRIDIPKTKEISVTGNQVHESLHGTQELSLWKPIIKPTFQK